MTSARRQFRFTITDLGLFLGKAPVTLRGWERQGIVSYPRDSRGDRTFGVDDIRAVLGASEVRRRIPRDRLKLIEATLTILELVEKR